MIMLALSISTAVGANGGSTLPERCVTRVIHSAGRPRLQVNGQLVSENLFVTVAIDSSLDVLPDVAKAGYQVVAIPFYAAKNMKAGNVGPIWLGVRQYDWQPLDDRFKQVRELAPGLKVIMYLILEPPSAWLKAHPTERVVYENEEPGDIEEPGDDDYVSIFGLQGPSMASEVYLQDVEHFLCEMIKHIDAQPYRDMFIGVHLLGGYDGQWFYRGRRECKYSDYSEPMRRYFARFLRKKYRNDLGLLQRSWQDSTVSFETAEIPSASRRIDGDHFRNPAQRQQVVDYTEALAQVPVDLIIRLASTVKRATDNRLWVSAYTGSAIIDTDGSSQGRGRLFQRQLLECPYLDGLTSVTYIQRALSEPGALGLITGSFRLHRKLAIHEQDIRTYLATSPEDRKQHLYGFTPDWDHQRNMLIREFGRILTSGVATWNYDMHGGWYSAPEFWELFAQFQQIRKDEMKRSFEPTAELAMVVDDLSQIYNPYDDKLLQNNSVGLQRTPLGWMGAPYDVYLLQDLFHKATPKYKCYFFLNTYWIDSKTRRRLHQLLAEAQATAIWLYAPGIICDGELGVGNIEQLTGFKVKRVTNAKQLVVLRDLDHPIVKGFGGASYGMPGKVGDYQSPAYSGGTFYCPQPADGVTVLGDLTSAGEPGLTIKAMDGWTSVYSAGLVFSPELLRNILSFSGGFLYADDAATGICANRNYLSVFAKTDGIRKLRLPEAATLRDLLTGEQVGSGSEFSMSFKQGEARIFAIEKE